MLLAAVSALSYLAMMTLPVRVNTIVADEIRKATGKRVFIGSVDFDIFKGLVLEDLVIYGERSVMIWAKRVSCGIPLWSPLKNRVSLPSLTVDRPAVYLVRLPDGSLNLKQLIRPGYSPGLAAAAIRSIAVKDARVLFIDTTLDPVFKERFDDISVDIKFSRPGQIAIVSQATLPVEPPSHMSFSGVYFFEAGELAGKLDVRAFALNEFYDYYKDSGCAFPSGRLDAESLLHLAGGTLDIDIDAVAKGLSVRKDNLGMKLDSVIKIRMRHELMEKTFEYAGTLKTKRMDIDGLEKIGRLENINADIEFDDSRLSSENIIADACGLRWKARINLVNYSSPVFDIYADSEARLGVVQKSLKDNFGIALPTDISGRSLIKLAMHMRPEEPFRMNGQVYFTDATVSLGSGNFPLEGLNGEAQFDLGGVKWSGIRLKYRDCDYTVSGALNDFDSPKIAIDVSSRDLRFKSSLSVNGNRIKVAGLTGRYFDSEFSASGSVDLGAKDAVKAEMSGRVGLDLRDLKKMAKDAAASLQKMKPAGKVDADIDLSGNLKEIGGCAIRMRAKSDGVTVYGTRHGRLTIDYAQQNGVGHIKSLSSLFYGGSLFATGKIDWSAKALPYSLSMDVKDVKLEKLKDDTGFRDKDVSGSIKALANLTGTLKDVTRLSGTGRISIANGRLWQLNLFKGVGSIIFTSDFSDIVFTEGSCDVKVSNKGYVINNFTLKSDLLNLYGSGTIGFDDSIDAKLRPEVIESVMGSGAQEAIAKAVSGNTVIKITGTIAKPDVKTQANFADVVGGIADAIFR